MYVIVALYVSAGVFLGIFTLISKSSPYLHTLPALFTGVFCLLKYVNTTSHVIQSFRVLFAQITTNGSATVAPLINVTPVGFNRIFDLEIICGAISQIKSVIDNVV